MGYYISLAGRLRWFWITSRGQLIFIVLTLVRLSKFGFRDESTGKYWSRQYNLSKHGEWFDGYCSSAEMHRNLKWYFGIGPLMLCSSSLNCHIIWQFSIRSILGAVRRVVGGVDAVMGLLLGTFLAGCASKFEGASKFDQMLPLDSHSGTFSSPQFVPMAINRSHFFAPFLNRHRRCSASDRIIITQ
jgi:hypothetical protein